MFVHQSSCNVENDNISKELEVGGQNLRFRKKKNGIQLQIYQFLAERLGNYKPFWNLWPSHLQN